MGQTRGRRRERKEKKELKQAGDFLNDDYVPLEEASDAGASVDAQHDGTSRDNRSSFFGLLDRAELEYFKNTESVLATNALNLDERDQFIDNVFKEAAGRELKLATNQVCSKLLERLTQLANEDQMQQLLKAFEPFAVDLAFQKFSSHCLEAIIMRSVALPSCETPLVKLAQRISKVVGDFTRDKYASHVLQTLILAFAGIAQDMRSKRSKLARKHTEIDVSMKQEGMETSSALKKEARELVNVLVDSMDKAAARKLAIDPVASTLIQTLIVSEAQLKSGYKLLRLILDESDSEGFVSHCLSDSVGSHFLETAIRVMPNKTMTQFKEKLPIVKLATSETESASYLVQALLEKSHLITAQKRDVVRREILPNLSSVLDRNVNIVVLALAVDFDAVAAAVVALFAEQELPLRDPAKTALFEQLAQYAPFVDRATDYVVALNLDETRDMALDATQSYVLQHLLTPTASIVSRRKLVNRLIPLIPQLSVNAYGSHIVDALWPACYKLKFNRERTATELMKHAEEVKHSPYGRKVWQNWRMEKYVHRRHEWWQAVKTVEDELRATLEPAAPTPLESASKNGKAKALTAVSSTEQRAKRRKTAA